MNWFCLFFVVPVGAVISTIIARRRLSHEIARLPEDIEKLVPNTATGKVELAVALKQNLRDGWKLTLACIWVFFPVGTIVVAFIGLGVAAIAFGGKFIMPFAYLVASSLLTLGCGIVVRRYLD